MARYTTMFLTKVVLLLLCVGNVLSSPASFGSGYYPTILARAADVKTEYDYVIVGGGTSGLTVADRLTEDGKYTVLVIEHGLFDNSTSVTTVAQGFQALLNASHLTSFPSVPQKNLNNRTITVIVGDLLGGSSAVNGMQMHRGQREDYDSWGNYFGKDTDWSWTGLLPYFKKAFHFHPPNADTAKDLNIKTSSKYWGSTSNVHVSFPTFNWPFLRTEVEAYADISGVEFPPDSGAGRPGVFWYPSSVDPLTQTRSHSRTGHWDGIHRRNYDIITGSKVLKVLFKDKVATSVQFVASKATNASAATVVKARKEVILAAGTIHTPQILQRSGVGPANLLKAAGIPLVVELPGVGQNFQDHPLPGTTSFEFGAFTVHPDPTDLQTNTTFIAQANAEFAEHRSGPLTIASGNAGTFLPFPVIAPRKFASIAARYLLQSPQAHLPPNTHPTLLAGYQAQKATLSAALRSTNSAFFNMFLRGASTEGSAIVLLHPTSRGSVDILPSDPFFSEPVVDYRALSNPIDLDMLTEFVRFIRRYFQVPSLAQYKPREVRPGANLTSDADIQTALRASLSPSTFHPIGTAAMLPLALGGVVDQKLLVYGVRRLSVVDASVQPTLPGAYTQQTVYAIAEKAADLIKDRQ